MGCSGPTLPQSSCCAEPRCSRDPLQTTLPVALAGSRHSTSWNGLPRRHHSLVCSSSFTAAAWMRESCRSQCRATQDSQEHPQSSLREAKPRQCGQGPHVCLASPPAWQRTGRVPEEVRHLFRCLLILREGCQLENSGSKSDLQRGASPAIV